jgi:hypothetical protein
MRHVLTNGRHQRPAPLVIRSAPLDGHHGHGGIDGAQRGRHQAVPAHHRRELQPSS